IFTALPSFKCNPSADSSFFSVASDDLYGDVRGTTYYGHLVVVTDSRGKIIAHDASNEWLFENLENLRKLPVGKYMDKTCTRAFPSSPRPTRY
ncbi:MAG: hypothetical protein U9P12_02905, partial [Verrucomicrobiota bacterium]|nr:hypothetical protein [Verrucomicrobiota bacterium]